MMWNFRSKLQELFLTGKKVISYLARKSRTIMSNEIEFADFDKNRYHCNFIGYLMLTTLGVSC